MNSQSVDELVIYSEAASDGSFRIQDSAPRLPIRRKLYVRTTWSPDSDPFIVPPFQMQRAALERFFSCPTLLISRTHVDIGDIRVQISYRLVEVQLLDANGSPAFTESDDWPSVWLRIKDRSGRTVEDSGLSRRSLRKGESTLAISLPVGTWNLEISYGNRSITTRLVLEEAAGPSRIIVKLPEVKA
jgi:hypothetical protein